VNLRVAPILLITAATLAAEPDRVVRVDLRNEAITPVTERFVTGAIRSVNEQGASAVVLVLDTLGGLVDSTREMVKAILQSSAPVVVYVAPAGARAASAGTFITMAAHVAAMAPGTTIGAAHPVSVAGLPGVPSEPAPKDAGKDNSDSGAGGSARCGHHSGRAPDGDANAVPADALGCGQRKQHDHRVSAPIDLFEMFTSGGRKRPSQPPEPEKEGTLVSA